MTGRGVTQRRHDAKVAKPRPPAFDHPQIARARCLTAKSAKNAESSPALGLSPLLLASLRFCVKKQAFFHPSNFLPPPAFKNLNHETHERHETSHRHSHFLPFVTFVPFVVGESALVSARGQSNNAKTRGREGRKAAASGPRSSANRQIKMFNRKERKECREQPRLGPVPSTPCASASLRFCVKKQAFFTLQTSSFLRTPVSSLNKLEPRPLRFIGSLLR